MRKLLFSFCFLFLFITAGLNLPAQQVTTIAGSEINSEVATGLKTFSDLDGNVFVGGGGTDSKRKDEFARNMIERISHDTTTNRTAYISFTLPEEKVPVPAYAFAMLNDKLYAFAETSGLSERTLYGAEVDKMTLQLKGAITKIFSFSLVAIKNYYAPSDFPEIQASENETRLLVSLLEKNGDSNLGQLRLKVFEDDLRPTWEKAFTPPGPKSGTFYIKGYKIYDNGNLLVFGYNRHPYETGNTKTVEYQYTNYISLLSDNGELSTDREIKINHFTVCTVLADITNNGKLIVSGSGVKSDGKEKPKAAIYYMAFEPAATEPLFAQVNEIDGDANIFLYQFAAIGWPYGVFMHSMFLSNDGSVVLIAESQDNNSLGDLYVYGLDPDGRLSWTKQIYKTQLSLFSYWMDSYKAFASGDDILIFYNDNVLNPVSRNEKTVEQFHAQDGGMLIACTINRDGNISKQKAFEFDKKERAPCIRTMVQTGPSEFAAIDYTRKMKSRISYTQVK